MTYRMAERREPRTGIEGDDGRPLLWWRRSEPTSVVTTAPGMTIGGGIAIGAASSMR